MHLNFIVLVMQRKETVPDWDGVQRSQNFFPDAQSRKSAYSFITNISGISTALIIVFTELEIMYYNLGENNLLQCN